jgi:hypothetical protein
VIDEVPVWPSLVAEIVAVPGPTAATSPLLLTVATPAFPLDQETDRPLSGAPSCAAGVALSCWVPPTNNDADPGLTATEATGSSDTVMLELPDRPSLVAVIVTLPGETPVTSPLEFTVATPLSPLDQVMARPLRGEPFCAVGVAVSS